MNEVSNCIVCGARLSGKQRSFCCVECKNGYYLSYDAQKERANKRKSALVSSHGGKCERCGYAFSLSALSFYDKDGESLHVDANVLANSSVDNLENKLEHALVLCRNCYEELQNPRHERHAEFISASTFKNEILKQVHDGVDLVGIKKKFAANLALCGVKNEQTLVLGVSGGVDSVAMLNLFTQSNMKLHIIVAHMNHGVRAEAHLDARLVSALAKKYGYKYATKTIAAPKDGNLEEGLRDARREFLLAAANSNKADFVALAHNANDQAETMILNLLRGSGPAGLGAMSMSDEKIIRPLLDFSRVEIEKYALANDLDWHEDPTNRDTSYKRNYIRHRLLPMFESLNPDYLNAISRTTYLQREIDEHFKEEAYWVIQNSAVIPATRLNEESPRWKAGIQGKRLGSWLATRNDKRVGTSAEKLRHLDRPLLYETLGLMYEEAKGDRKNLSLAHLSAIEALVSDSHGAKDIDLPGNVAVRRRYDKLDFYLKKEHNTSSAPGTKKLKLGEQSFGNWKVTVTATTDCHPCESEEPLRGDRKRSLGLRPGMTTLKTGNDEITVDAETLKNLVIRTRQPGDYILKKGLDGKKKLQDLFVDAKIDRVKRDSYPILVNHAKEEILWVPGLAKSEYKPKDNIDLYQINIEEAGHETKKI